MFKKREVPTDIAPETNSRGKRVLASGAKVAGLGLVAASGAVAGAFYDPLDAQIGPHSAEINLTLDSYTTGDLGPVGSIDIPSGLPAGIGADIVIKEIPDDDIDVDAYARFLSDPSDNIKMIEDRYKERALLHGGLAVGTALAGSVLLGKQRREELWARASSIHAPQIAAVALITSGALLVDTSLAKSEYSVAVDATFNETPLEGARVSGAYMKKIVNELAPQVFDHIEANDGFYEQATSNLERAAEKDFLLRGTEHLQTALFYTDNHCNIGTSEIVRQLETLSGASVVFDAGDTTMGGTEFEAQCLAVIGDAVSSPIVYAPGNHDSKTTERQAKARGFKVLNGKPIKVAGLTVLGDSDPRRSEFNKEMYLQDNEDIQLVGERLADVACNSSNGIDVMLVHDKNAATASLERGCVDIALSGHYHKFSEEKVGDAVQIVGGSSGGVSKGHSTFGPLRSPAEFYIIQHGKKTGNYIRHQRITISPDASVQIHQPMLAGAVD